MLIDCIQGLVCFLTVTVVMASPSWVQGLSRVGEGFARNVDDVLAMHSTETMTSIDNLWYHAL